MPVPFTSKVLTANHLLEGDVIYLAPGGEWTRHLREALLFEEETAANDALSAARLRTDMLVDPYLADAVYNASGRPHPTHYREAFRASGPSNYRHGKQAGN